MNSTTPFKRTRVTWMGYTLMTFFGLGISLLGPIVPFIGERLELTYGQIGLHFTVLATGNFITGLSGDAIASRLGNRRTAWGGTMLQVLGTTLIIFGPAFAVTLLGAFMVGFGSGITALITTALLADEHPIPDHQTKALSEGNIMAGTGVALTPLIVGGLEQSDIGWQAHIVVIAAFFVVAVLAFGRAQFPLPRNEKADGAVIREPLPPLFWIFGGVLFMTIAIEWAIMSWTPDFLATVVGMDRGTAATLGSAFAWAIVLGRSLGRWLMSYLNTDVMLVGAFVLLAVFSPIFVFSPFVGLSVAVLFILGVATSNQFPLGLDMTMSAGGRQTRLASARIGMIGGFAALSMPQLIGSLADKIGLQLAFLVVPVLATLAIAVTFAAFRRRAYIHARAATSAT